VNPFYSEAQYFENERVRHMEEMYRMHLAEAALLRERLGQRGDTGPARDHLRQQQATYPGLMQMQARHASDASGDMMAIDREPHVAERLAIDRAQAARRVDMMALQRVLDNERVLRQEAEFRNRRNM
jgi:hypothetical protein